MLSHEDIEQIKALIKENGKTANNPIIETANKHYMWHKVSGNEDFEKPPLNVMVEATIEYNGYNGPYRRNSYVYYIPKYCQYDELMGGDHGFMAYNVFCDDNKLYIEPGWYEEPNMMEKVSSDKVIAWRHIETYKG